jgi:hypothetical protein
VRITRDLLLKIARETAAERTRQDRGLLAIYLHGSLLEDEPLLGGAADIDLFIIHNDSAVPQEREIIPVTDEVHLDITHQARPIFRQARELRLHPWLGHTLYGAKSLYDPQHFMDFVQASVRGQFYRADNVLRRVRPQAEHARQMWFGFTQQPPAPGTASVLLYLRAVVHAVNAIAGLNGPPLTDRRLLLNFPARAEAVRHPGLQAGLLGLLGGPTVDAAALKAWLPAWQEAWQALPTAGAPVRLHPARLAYYGLAFDAMLGSDQYAAVLWPLLLTWTLAAAALPTDGPHLAAWQAVVTHLGLAGPAFPERLQALDAYLDLVEEIIETWAKENGA